MGQFTLHLPIPSTSSHFFRSSPHSSQGGLNLFHRMPLSVHNPNPQPSPFSYCHHQLYSNYQEKHQLPSPTMLKLSRKAPTHITNYTRTIKKSTNTHHQLYLNYQEKHQLPSPTILKLSRKTTSCHHQPYLSYQEKHQLSSPTIRLNYPENTSLS